MDMYEYGRAHLLSLTERRDGTADPIGDLRFLLAQIKTILGGASGVIETEF